MKWYILCYDASSIEFCLPVGCRPKMYKKTLLLLITDREAHKKCAPPLYPCVEAGRCTKKPCISVKCVCTEKVLITLSTNLKLSCEGISINKLISHQMPVRFKPVRQ